MVAVLGVGVPGHHLDGGVALGGKRLGKLGGVDSDWESVAFHAP
jgi:hypothetical protein